MVTNKEIQARKDKTSLEIFEVKNSNSQVLNPIETEMMLLTK